MSDITDKYIQKHQELLDNIKADLPNLENLLETYSSGWNYEDPIYRFYHESFKVYDLQDDTQKIVNALRNLSVNKDQKLNGYFEEIIYQGAQNKEWKVEHNQDWYNQTVPFVNAFFHAKFFLEMAVKYGNELEKAPQIRPYGWSALLNLYNLR